MKVASKDLCEQLYEVSGWKTGRVIRDNPTESSYNGTNVIAYEYDLGYLIRKLPKHIGDQWLRIAPITDDMWAAYYITMGIKSAGQDEWADTPEDAAVKLCLELFQQGILTKVQQTEES